MPRFPIPRFQSTHVVRSASAPVGVLHYRQERYALAVYNPTRPNSINGRRLLRFYISRCIDEIGLHFALITVATAAAAEDADEKPLIYPWARARETPAVDITALTSSGHETSSVTSPFESAWPLSYTTRPLISRSFRDVCTHARRNQTPPRHPVCTPTVRLGKRCKSLIKSIRNLVHCKNAFV